MPQRKPIYVLGTGLSHDGSACLLKDGRICVAIEKERITRQKHDGFNDTAAIQYCLAAEGIRMQDLTLIVQNANMGMFEFGNAWYRGERLITDAMPAVSISHHLAHAYSAIGTSPFPESAVLVIDGCGSGLDECIDLDGALIPEAPTGDLAALWFEKDSYYAFDGTTLRPLLKDFSPLGMGLKAYPMYPTTTRHSIGGVYAGVSRYVFGGIDDSGKLMGLAPYGRRGVHEFEIFDLTDGRVFVRYEWMKEFREPCRTQEQFQAKFRHYADLAFWVQKEIERAILYLACARHSFHPERRLCYAGGVALNAVANRRLYTETPFEHVYIQPAAGDNGLAIGCAYYGWMEVLKRDRVVHDGSTHLGRRWHRTEISDALAAYSDRLDVTASTHIAEDTAAILGHGQTVGWFQGRSEFGPRALGGRSILADPRLPDIGLYINRQIKRREEFRPFAPSVPLEDLLTYFDCEYESPYMLLVAMVRPEWRARMPSVVHKDNSARIQTVDRRLLPDYHRVLRAFHACSGISVVLNTSLNRRGMPIVETARDAIEFFLSSGLHVLVMDQYVVRKEGLPQAEPSPVAKLFAGPIKEALESRLEETRLLNGLYQFNIGKVEVFTVQIAPGGIRIEEGLPRLTPDVLVEAEQDVFEALLASSADETRLMTLSRMTVLGDARQAHRLTCLMGTHSPLTSSAEIRPR